MKTITIDRKDHINIMNVPPYIMLVIGLNCAEEDCMLLIVVGKLRVLGTWQ